MKTSFLILVMGCLALPLHATNAGLGTVDQPVNLGAQADPSRIPLGPVAVESNYNYGLGPAISAPRPSLHGAMEWEKGSILDQNLASVFGITVSNHDAPQTPVEIRVKGWPRPEYSPYTKEQVVASLIHCVLRSTRGTLKHPIDIRILADSSDDAKRLEKYSGEYVNSVVDPDDLPEKPTPVPGCVLETDSNGVTWVVFPDRADAAKPAAAPVFMPFRLGGEAGPDLPTWLLLPVWPGTGVSRADSLAILGQPYPLFYDRFKPSTGGGPEVNCLFAGKSGPTLDSFRVVDGETFEAIYQYPMVDSETLSASILALVISAAPSDEKPLSVILRTGKSAPHDWLEDFQSCEGWETEVTPDMAAGKAVGERIELRASFAWDAAAARLSRGALPKVAAARTITGQVVLTAGEVTEKVDDGLPEQP